jgi:DNA-binding NarL/FixJ family response regulator
MFREGLQLILSGATDIVVRGHAGTAAEAFRRAREQTADVILLDVSLPDVDGLSALSQIKEASGGARTLILSMHADANHILRALEMGADGYIAKQSASRVLLDGIRTVYAGKPFMDEISQAELQRSPVPVPAGVLDSDAHEEPQESTPAGNPRRETDSE